jgi:hypothetical protein
LAADPPHQDFRVLTFGGGTDNQGIARLLGLSVLSGPAPGCVCGQTLASAGVFLFKALVLQLSIEFLRPP